MLSVTISYYDKGRAGQLENLIKMHAVGRKITRAKHSRMIAPNARLKYSVVFILNCTTHTKARIKQHLDPFSFAMFSFISVGSLNCNYTVCVLNRKE